ncbi:AraC family transcriptional regulator [Staphylococcus gallinarum]|jgi:AraC-like DNA-binding protein|uniref:AraC family transcriptional regulator n=1 Tax=Staphylococcus gallinarum TaxID=1293 RepID=UPI001E434AE3|nr:AraC family transcriptional regulator [Staphylococcus gallinarum]MCD8785515.1 AraC family transcriptional regulator [Staphylococcus gallinarum]MCD8828859.1 AraC family transcriptional regulator [Staphylococcus gallinarum]MCD8858219.1 AraC family transcriptional regulator [Staphylococcus gallinarum]MCD8899765.1 AraC family transcriptional regulator [Staphylococcus gallinarum]MCD8902769.1 AraC family transcriptional regulator [Staphylococcus gallinarum]
MNRDLPININESLEEHVAYHSVGFSIIPYIIEFDFERHDFMPLHWHNDLQISWVYEGELEFLIDGQVLTVDSRDIVFINRNKLHSSYSTKEDAKTLCINFELEFLNAQIIEDYIDPILNNESFTYYKLPITSQFSRYFSAILNEIPTDNDFLVKESTSTNYFDAVNLINQVIEGIVYEFEGANYLSNAEDFNNMNSLLTYIHEHYGEKITISDLTAHAHISKSFCNQLFRKYTKQSPMKYLLLYRLQIAQELLVHTDKSITSISDICGFGTISYFIERFRIHYKMSPLKFRQTYQKQKNFTLREYD